MSEAEFAEAASALCLECGLCCDGSLFSEVELASKDEGSDLEALGLNIEDAENDEPAVLMQPCGALCGTRCGIYIQRPECCRTFECKVLRQLRSGWNTELSLKNQAQQDLRPTVRPVDLARAKVRNLRLQIERLRALLDSLDCDSSLPIRERCFEAQEILSERNGEKSRVLLMQLGQLMASVQHTIVRDFLDC